jgi:hypothetical protein
LKNWGNAKVLNFATALAAIAQNIQKRILNAFLGNYFSEVFIRLLMRGD